MCKVDINKQVTTVDRFPLNSLSRLINNYERHVTTGEPDRR